MSVKVWLDDDDRMPQPLRTELVSLCGQWAGQAAGLAFASCCCTIETAIPAVPEPALASLPDVLRQAPAKRRIEFLAGRRCASAALQAVGCAAVAALPIGPRRAPLWPAGFTGSISHGGGLAIAVAAPLDAVSALGIDIQPELPPDQALRLAPGFSDAAERRLGAALPITTAAWLTRLWAIKESVAKALDAQQAGQLRFPDFRDLRVVAVDAQTVTVRLRDGSELLARHAAVGSQALALCVLGPRTAR